MQDFFTWFPSLVSTRIIRYGTSVKYLDLTRTHLPKNENELVFDWPNSTSFQLAKRAVLYGTSDKEFAVVSLDDHVTSG